MGPNKSHESLKKENFFRCCHKEFSRMDKESGTCFIVAFEDGERELQAKECMKPLKRPEIRFFSRLT
jgi:hypothetical protein